MDITREEKVEQIKRAISLVDGAMITKTMSNIATELMASLKAKDVERAFMLAREINTQLDTVNHD